MRENAESGGLIAQETLLQRIVNRIRQSLELQAILNETVAEVRTFLETDRVMIYRFHPDESGEVIAEAIHGDRLPSLLGLNFPADDIPPHARELFVTARQRTIVDLNSQKLGVSLPDTSTVEWSALPSDICYRPVDPCHVEYLKAMGVNSSVVVPLLHQHHHQPKLWGLLVSHHGHARDVTPAEVQFLQLVADQVAVAIAQAALFEQVRHQAIREKTVNQIATLLHSHPEMQFQAALEQMVTIFQGSGGRLYLAPETDALPACVYQCGEQPTTAEHACAIEQLSSWQLYVQPAHQVSEHYSLWAVTDLYQPPELRTLAALFRSTPIRGFLVIPLQYRQQCLGYITLFRNPIDTEKLWAGQFDPDQRQLQPRNSFDVWCESQKGQAPQWYDAELDLALAIGNHFAMAVQQHQLFLKVQGFNAVLEQQVRERTLGLQKAAEQQKALALVISKIRASLDLTTIFAATVTEVRASLNADRVGVFRFYPESGFDDGEFVSEAVLPAYPSALAAKIHDHCFGEQFAGAYQQGKIQAITDIETAALSECHVHILAQFQIRANLIVPLLKGDALWGLLCIHQCSEPRQWEANEIDFVRQVATQLGVALQQAELLSQTQQQTLQLGDALNNLKQAQTHLIQTEKMSSLGQLVAGVAHEINNPVNFIYGNINHASNYTQDLLELLQLYQQHYPQPGEAIRHHAHAVDLEFLTADLPKILASMKTGTERIRQIVLSLRNFSRFDQAEVKAVDIHEGIDSTLMILQHRLKAKLDFGNIDVIKEYGDLPLIECYAGQLNQVFMNLLSNAIDALEEVRERSPDFIPCITICTQLQGDRVNIRIADNGPGMTEATRARIFDPFFTTKPVGKGTGLGLSISFQIVTERHGGTLECRSILNEGTAFEIVIPRQQA